VEGSEDTKQTEHNFNVCEFQRLYFAKTV